VKLVVHELYSGIISQEVTTTRNTLVEAIRPHLYVHGVVAGSLILKITDANGELIATSTSVTISSISASNYFHGYVRFYINAYLRKDVNYIISLYSSGYTFSESGYVGWCNGYDLAKYSSDFTPSNSNFAALDYEIWARNP